MSTARDLIYGSLRLIGAVATGEVPSASEQVDALSVLNDMLDSWTLESLMIVSKIKETFVLIPGQQTYTMGVGGNFNTSRPLEIQRAAIIDTTNPPINEIPVAIINLDQWANIAIKSTNSYYPTMLYPEGTSPLETLNLWPIPSIAVSLAIYSWKPLTSIATPNTVITVPPGYAKALRYNLAIELAPEYGKQPDQAIVAGALESKENIKRKNIKPLYLETDAGLSNQSKSFNWYIGE